MIKYLVFLVCVLFSGTSWGQESIEVTTHPKAVEIEVSDAQHRLYPLGSLVVTIEGADSGHVNYGVSSREIFDFEFPADTLTVDGVAITNVADAIVALESAFFKEPAGAGGIAAEADPVAAPLIAAETARATAAEAALEADIDGIGVEQWNAGATLTTTNGVVVNPGQFYVQFANGTTFADPLSSGSSEQQRIAKIDCYEVPLPALTGGATDNPATAIPSGRRIGQFVITESGPYTITHSGTGLSATNGFGISSAPYSDDAANIIVNATTNVFVTSAAADRITPAQPSKNFVVTLSAGTYYVGVFSGGNAAAESHSVLVSGLSERVTVFNLEDGTQYAFDQFSDEIDISGGIPSDWEICKNEPLRELLFTQAAVASGASSTLDSITWQEVVDRYETIVVNLRVNNAGFTNKIDTSRITDNGTIAGPLTAALHWAINSTAFADGQFGFAITNNAAPAQELEIWGVLPQGAVRGIVTDLNTPSALQHRYEAGSGNIGAGEPFPQQLGYLMYTEEEVDTRFATATSISNQNDPHLVGVYFDGTNWLYSDNGQNGNTTGWPVFTPAPSDVLFAIAFFGNGPAGGTAVRPFPTDGTISGIAHVSNYGGLDSVLPDTFSGSSNAGEFQVSGTLSLGASEYHVARKRLDGDYDNNGAFIPASNAVSSGDWFTLDSLARTALVEANDNEEHLTGRIVNGKLEWAAVYTYTLANHTTSQSLVVPALTNFAGAIDQILDQRVLTFTTATGAPYQSSEADDIEPRDFVINSSGSQASHTYEGNWDGFNARWFVRYTKQ